MPGSHYVMHSVRYLAWTSCKCDANHNHYPSEEVWTSSRPPHSASSSESPAPGTEYLQGFRAGVSHERRRQDAMQRSAAIESTPQQGVRMDDQRIPYARSA